MMGLVSTQVWDWPSPKSMQASDGGYGGRGMQGGARSGEQRGVHPLFSISDLGAIAKKARFGDRNKWHQK